MRRLLKYAFVLILFVGLGGGAAWWFWPREAIAGLQNDTAQAEITKMEDVLLVSGLVRPAVTIELRAEASGIVELVSVKEGDRVAAGQELVRLDSSLAQASLDQAKANLLQAELQDAATKLDLDQDTLELRKRTFDRTQKLFADGLVSRDDLEKSELELRSAERSVERARRNIEGSQARIAQVKASVDQANTQLLHTSIRAPFEAFVLRRQVEIGSGVAGVSQSASGGSVLMTLGDARESALHAKATAADARRLRIGMKARVRLDSDPSNPIPAVVRLVSTAGDVDQTSKLTTFPVVIALETQPPGGWVNVPAQAEIVLGASTDAITLPERCVRTDPAGRSFVIVEGQAGTRQRQVELGVVQGDRVQVRAGLDKGQTAVCRRLPAGAAPNAEVGVRR